MYVGVIREPIKVIIFSIITCGIYGLYWYYITMEDLNSCLNERRFNSAMLLILGIFCFPVIWYILYKIDNTVEEICASEGIAYRSNFILWLLLTLVFGVGALVALYQVQSAMNMIWENRLSKSA